MTYHQVCNWGNKTGTTRGAETTHPSGTHGFIPDFLVGIFSFMCSVLYTFVCPFVLFHLAIVLSVLLRFAVSDYPFGVFKLFLETNSQLYR